MRVPDGLGTCRRKKAKEGEACGGRQGPWCEEGFQCIGKAVLVDGQGTCRRDGILQNYISLYIFGGMKKVPYMVYFLYFHLIF